MHIFGTSGEPGEGKEAIDPPWASNLINGGHSQTVETNNHVATLTPGLFVFLFFVAFRRSIFLAPTNIIYYKNM